MFNVKVRILYIAVGSNASNRNKWQIKTAQIFKKQQYLFKLINEKRKGIAGDNLKVMGSKNSSKRQQNKTEQKIKKSRLSKNKTVLTM